LNPLQEALKLPKQTPEEEAVRNQALQEGLQKAVAVPYGLAMKVNCLWPTLVQLATLGNLTTISDLQVGSQSAALLCEGQSQCFRKCGIAL
jgi:glutamate formiminotransferase/formiminotetrahydrofolate cyclodeaminase